MDHEDDRDPGIAGFGCGSQPGQIAVAGGEAIHDAVLHLHDEQGG